MPKPKPTKIVCDTCGLDWKLHKPSKRGTVSLSECVRLLKAELAKPKPYPFIGVQSSGTLSTPVNPQWLNFGKNH